MSFSDIHPGDPINAINVQQVIDALKGTAGKGVPLTVSAVNDSARYALTLENTEATNSRALNVLKNDGSVLIRADATGVTLGQPLNLPTGSVTSGAIADGTIATADLANNAVTNAKLGTDTARLNLLTNGGFEIWQRGASFSTSVYTADRWLLQINGSDTCTIAKAPPPNVGPGSTAAAVVTFTLGSGGGLTALSNKMTTGDGNGLAGRTVSLSMYVWSSAANAVRIALSTTGTGGTTTYSTFHPGGSSWQTLTVTAAVPTDATIVYVIVYFAASATIYLDNAMLVVGSVAADYAPLHPADDLARCQRYYELLADPASTALIVASAGTVSAGGVTARAVFSYKTRKAVSPTVTIVPSWSGTNAPSLNLNGQDTYACRVSATSIAAGDFFVINSGAGSTISVEANP